MTINVVNKYKHVPDVNADVYIGRGSVLGNPWPITPTDSRDAVIDRYEEWLGDRIEDGNLNVLSALAAIQEIEEEHGHVNLVCFCRPSRCHGDVIKKAIAKAKLSKPLGEPNVPV